MSTHRIAVIPGDGIGKEVMPEGLRALDAAARRFGIDLACDHFDFASCDYYAQHGQMLPDDWKQRIGGHAAIFYGAEGRPLAPGAIDMMIVRENTEGEYSSIGGRMFEGTEREVVIQETVMSRVGVDRVLKFAFELAQRRPRRKLTSATKSNGISITMPYWDERVAAMAAQYPGVAVDQFHIDILTAHFVQRPTQFDVVVASNLFGDILSDLGPACTGTIGIAPSANLNPTREWPSLFEPVHGSAPDIAGKGIANPIGQIWSGALMLDFLGHRDAHDAMLAAIEAVLADPAAPRTPDLGGTAGTADVGRAIAQAIEQTNRG
jgi:tartrate dehydrogenase/decarboxylase/D-malate dehydrogenase